MKLNWADVIGFLIIVIGSNFIFSSTTDMVKSFIGILIIAVGTIINTYANDIREDK